MFSNKASIFLLFAAIGLAKAQTFSGQATYYHTGLGSCGQTNVDSDLIAAINAPQYNPGLCGRRIRVFYQGRSVDVTVADRCAGCQSGDVDLTPGAFSRLADLGAGRIPITWQFI